MQLTCLVCKQVLAPKRSKFCSNKCQIDYQYKEYINKWKQGLVDGNRGINTKNISRHIRRFLIEKYEEKCSVCGWDTKHPITKYVPLEIDHLDEDADNNIEGNLRLICPNCHALTSNFRNLNKGKGRKWRKDRYLKY